MESDDLLPVIEAREQFTKTPDAAFVDWKVGCTPLAPEKFKASGILSRSIARVPTGINDFQQIITSGATKILLSFCIQNAAANASELSGIQLG